MITVCIKQIKHNIINFSNSNNKRKPKVRHAFHFGQKQKEFKKYMQKISQKN